MRVAAAAVGLCCLVAVAPAAQSPPGDVGNPPPRPAYQPYRYDEDWSSLSDPRLRTDAIDRLKYVPFGDRPDWYLSIGGETRWRFEQFRNPGFGLQPPDGNGYALQRYLLHSDWHLGSRARVSLDVQSSIESGRVGGPRPTDENLLDIHQAFVDFTWGQSSARAVTLRAGRHEVAFGAGRLLSAAEGLNARRSFEGLRLIGRRDVWTLNSIVIRPVRNIPGVMDDRTDASQLVWGTGAFGRVSRTGRNLALYYIGAQREDARFDQGVGDAVRHSFGIRHWRPSAAFDYEQEAIMQLGRFAGAPIRAWALASDQGLAVPWPPRLTRLGLRVFATSGDRDPGRPRLESFDPLFPSIAYSGKAGLIGPTNLITVAPTITVTAHRRVRVMLERAWFWRSSLDDGVYGIDRRLLRSSSEATGRAVGSQTIIELDAQLTTHFGMLTSLAVFRTGPFLSSMKDVRYLAAQAAYRF